MICKVLSTSLGYNGRVYTRGEDIEVSTSAEVERLSGYGVIAAEPISETLKEEVPTAQIPPKTVFDIKTVKGGRKRK